MNHPFPAIVGGASAAFAAGVVGGWLLARLRRRNQPPKVTPEPRAVPDPSSITKAALLEDEITSLIYSVSHDVRAPLRSIDGFSRALEEDYASALDPTARGYIDRVRANASRINGYIEHLLALSRLGRAEMHPERVDVSAMATAICERLARDQPERNVSWSVQSGVNAWADPELLTACLDRLLANAWKFTGAREHATVALAARREGRATIYSVADDGAGFEMAFAGKLFGAFQRLHPAEEFPGEGVGLAVARRIVHRHGGRIWADAKPGEGATFFFTLGSGNEQ